MYPELPHHRQNTEAAGVGREAWSCVPRHLGRLQWLGLPHGAAHVKEEGPVSQAEPGLPWHAAGLLGNPGDALSLSGRRHFSIATALLTSRCWLRGQAGGQAEHPVLQAQCPGSACSYRVLCYPESRPS